MPISKEKATENARVSAESQFKEFCAIIDASIEQHGDKCGDYTTAVVVKLTKEWPSHVILRAKREYGEKGWHCDYFSQDWQFNLR